MEQLLKDKDGKLTNFIEKIRPVKEEMIKMGFPQVGTNTSHKYSTEVLTEFRDQDETEASSGPFPDRDETFFPLSWHPERPNGYYTKQ